MVDGATYGMEVVLTGSAEDLTSELAQAELMYIRSPGYDGPDAFQVLCSLSCVLTSLFGQFPGKWVQLKEWPRRAVAHRVILPN